MSSQITAWIHTARMYTIDGAKTCMIQKIIEGFTLRLISRIHNFTIFIRFVISQDCCSTILTHSISFTMLRLHSAMILHSTASPLKHFLLNYHLQQPSPLLWSKYTHKSVAAQASNPPTLRLAKKKGKIDCDKRTVSFFSCRVKSISSRPLPPKLCNTTS